MNKSKSTFLYFSQLNPGVGTVDDFLRENAVSFPACVGFFKVDETKVGLEGKSKGILRIKRVRGQGY